MIKSGAGGGEGEGTGGAGQFVRGNYMILRFCRYTVRMVRQIHLVSIDIPVLVQIFAGGNWSMCFRFIGETEFPRLCSVGYAQTIPGVFTPGITLQGTYARSVGHSYPCPELLEVLYDIHTRTRNFWKFCTPVSQIPGVRVHHFYNLCEFCTPVPQY